VLDKTTTIENFLEAAAAKQPTPGGGSVAALAGALAAAMGEMVLNYSVGKKGLEEHRPKLQSTLEKFNLLRERMLSSMALDQSAYEFLTFAKKMDADDPRREKRITLALRTCISTPMGIATTATRIIRLAYQVVEIVNPYLLSDLAVCAELAMATTRAAIHNVRVNLSDVTDFKRRLKIEDDCDRILSMAVRMIQQVIPRILERVSQV
jgi:formiminotetrahydrofolate cyclodeaminase